MSLTGPAIITSSTSTTLLIIDAALADYTKLTGTDLSKTPFATALEQSNSLEAVLQLLHEREKAFKEYRDDDRKLLNCLSPAVKVLRTFSDIIGEAVSQVKPHMSSGDSFNSDLLRFLSHPQAPCLLASVLFLTYVPSTRFSTGYPVMNEHTRPPKRFHRAMMRFSSCSGAWGASSSVWRSIREFHPIR
jgi:hypothetical protein